MTMHPFNLDNVDSSWRKHIQNGLDKVSPDYLKQLKQSQDWLPGPEKIFNSFSLPLNKVNYILFGESPYPRRESANGYAFWDNSIQEIWSTTGLSKKVNRATSMRNILKMFLLAEGLLKKTDVSQEAISRVNKQHLVTTNNELFTNFLQQGFLLVNATPVLQSGPPQKDARAWQPFIKEILACLQQHRPNAKLILLGRIANNIDNLVSLPAMEKLYSPHPYNISFITQQNMIDFFKPLHLLRKT